MCGFAGVMCDNRELLSSQLIERMTDAISHRGPDSSGYWSDFGAGVALGHRRLSVVELTAAGDQPMQLKTGRYVIVFNGEIYNHLEIRKELPSENWVGFSDTETLLTAIENWGVRKAVQRCTGMFAFALWDLKEKQLVLARDRMGEKPLYYGWTKHLGEDCFLFGSELRALSVHKSFSAKIDRTALSLYMQHCYVPAPHCIYEGFKKLLPGHLLTIKMGSRRPNVEKYWSLPEVASFAKRGFSEQNVETVVDQLEQVLFKSVSDQMIADVSVGAFLSGGVDSSTIVALMQAQSTKPVQTFTIGFEHDSYNEADHARQVAAHLGTAHTELYITPQEALEAIPALPVIYSEPFADSSQIPTYLVSKLAKQNVTVALSGDGGDELFAGYNRYLATRRHWKVINKLPMQARAALSAAVLSISPDNWDKITNPVNFLMSNMSQIKGFGAKMHKSAIALNSESIEALYRNLLLKWDAEKVIVGSTNQETYFQENWNKLDGFTDIEKMMVADSIGYLPDDILVKVDRAAMAVSLETRVPFLDHRVIELAWQVPANLKMRGGVGKWVLRQLLYRHVPKSLVDRPKMGFGMPIDKWLRGSLRDWAENLLDKRRLISDGLFDPIEINSKWQEHLTGKRNWSELIWNVLMFNAWLDEERRFKLQYKSGSS